MRIQARAAVAYVSALVLGAFWRLTTMKGVVITDDIFASDLWNESLPYRVALGRALRSGQWPLWVPEIYGGFPLLARAEAGVFYPFNIVFFGLFPSDVALNLTILFTRLLVVTDLSIVALAALAATKLAIGAAGFRRPRSLIQVALLAAVTADLLHFQLRQNPIVDAARWRTTPQTVEILKRDPSVFRTYCIGGAHSHRRAFELAGGWQGDLEPFIEQREFVQPSTNVLYGLSSPAGYANCNASP